MDTKKTVIKRIKNLYIHSIIGSIPNLLGSTNMLGNPAEVVRDFGSGLEYLYNENKKAITHLSEGEMNIANEVGGSITNLLRCSLMGATGFVKNISGTFADGASN